jgi:hypothetical protein
VATSNAPRRASRLRIVVLGYVVRGPLGGMVWSNLQYLMGLARLGHDVWFVEDSDDYPSCYDPARGVTDTDPAYGLHFAERVLGRIGLSERWAYHDAHAQRWLGPAAPRILEVCAAADLLLDLCGVNPLRAWLERIPVRVLVDEDPAFTQIRHLGGGEARRRALAHTAFFTFGANFGRPGCSIPDDGLPWRPTRQPVVLEALAATPPPDAGRFTSVMQWESYPALEHEGRRYGMKADSFAPFLALPARCGRIFELALGGPAAPRELLRANGWRLRDPVPLTRDPWTYLRYVAASRAEFGVAKHGYVTSSSGWFSERSVAYLASGRPALVQDTGFSAWLPTGKGLLAFSSPEQACAGVEEILRDGRSHARAARELAEAQFASGRVLTDLIEAVFAGSR